MRCSPERISNLQSPEYLPYRSLPKGRLMSITDKLPVSITFSAVGIHEHPTGLRHDVPTPAVHKQSPDMYTNIVASRLLCLPRFQQLLNT